VFISGCVSGRGKVQGFLIRVKLSLMDILTTNYSDCICEATLPWHTAGAEFILNAMV
jgi:hypothetical protein